VVKPKTFSILTFSYCICFLVYLGKCVLREAAKTKEQTRGPGLPQSFDMTLTRGGGMLQHTQLLLPWLLHQSCYMCQSISCSSIEKKHCVNVKWRVPAPKIFTIPQLRKTYFIKQITDFFLIRPNLFLSF